MKKINRREYLIAMGATAGAMASTPKLHLLAQTPQKTRVSPSKPELEFLNEHVVQSGIRRSQLRSTEDVKLVFHGLMGFALNQRGECEIGFHSKDSAKHKHRLSIMAFEVRDDICTDAGHEENIPPGASLTFDVSLPQLDGVKFYQPTLTGGAWHDNDFRWVVNLEGSDWYGRYLRPWQGNAYKPVMVVRNGLFYTLMRTASVFRRQTLGQVPSPENVIHIGSIAEYIGTNIYLKANGSVTLTIQNRPPITLRKAANVRYEIHFNNDCKKIRRDEDCVFNPYHNDDETERNDFYMHRDALDLGGGPKYQLVLALPGRPPAPAICKTVVRLTDEAPCSGAGYGGPDGFPGFP